jgi:hypothetical protein
LRPTVYSGTSLLESPIVDQTQTVDCESTGSTFQVDEEIELRFVSGQKWLIFMSRPATIKCQAAQGSPTILHVVDDDGAETLIIRAAMIMGSPDQSQQQDDDYEAEYRNTLRSSKDLFPGELTRVLHSFDVQTGNEAGYAKISFDWDPQSMTGSGSSVDEMITFTLPHHQEIMDPASTTITSLCTSSLMGSVCLAKGSSWNTVERLPTVSFQAPRHPDPEFLPAIAASLMEDIKYQIPENFQIGAGDTYFSGKTLAKLARILLITEEVKELCAVSYTKSASYEQACNGLVLPSDTDVAAALDQLRQAATVWIKDNEQAPFVYDTAWGGLVSCGCLYQDGACTNQSPDCPAFTDQGLNFGNGFYNGKDRFRCFCFC